MGIWGKMGGGAIVSGFQSLVTARVRAVFGARGVSHLWARRGGARPRVVRDHRYGYRPSARPLRRDASASSCRIGRGGARSRDLAPPGTAGRASAAEVRTAPTPETARPAV